MPGGVAAGDFVAPGAVPCVSVSAFGLDIGESIFHDRIASEEDGAVGRQFVESRPERRGGGIGFDLSVSVAGDEADAGEGGSGEPGGAGVDGGLDGGGGGFEAHEQAEDAGAFGAAERGGFEGSAGSGFEGYFVVLGAPDGEGAVGSDLSAEDGVDAAVERLAGGVAGFLGEEGELGLVPDFAEEFEQADHGAVVEGDVTVVAGAGRVGLGPAPAGVLRGEDMVHCPPHRLAGGRVIGVGSKSGEETNFVDGGAVVPGAVEGVGGSGKAVGGGVGVLGPITADRLEREDVGGDGQGLGGAPPGGGLAEEGGEGGAARRGRERGRGGWARGGLGWTVADLLVGEVQELAPVVVGEVVSAGAEVIADAGADGLIDGGRVGGGEFGGDAVGWVPGGSGEAGGEVFSCWVGPEVLGGTGDVERARGDEGEQVVLVDRETMFVLGVLGEVAAEPVGEGAGDDFDGFAEDASAEGRAGTTGVVGDHGGEAVVVCGRPESGLAHAGMTDGDDTGGVEFGDLWDGVDEAGEAPGPEAEGAGFRGAGWAGVGAWVETMENALGPEVGGVRGEVVEVEGGEGVVSGEDEFGDGATGLLVGLGDVGIRGNIASDGGSGKVVGGIEEVKANEGGNGVRCVLGDEDGEAESGKWGSMGVEVVDADLAAFGAELEHGVGFDGKTG